MREPTLFDVVRDVAITMTLGTVSGVAMLLTVLWAVDLLSRF